MIRDIKAMTVIKVENLTKKYKELVAVDNVNLEIEERECFGLLGPNGAGKTTLIRMITAVSPPTAGNIIVLGKDLAKAAREVKANLGVVSQVDNLDPDLTTLQNLLVYARYFDIPKKEAYQRSIKVLRLFQLEEKMNNHIKELSGGMRRRLILARGLINRPRILILDEPSVGLDPQSRHLVWQKLKELKAQGVTLLLCTQNMEEAAVLCDRVAIVHQGKILVVDTPAALVSRYVGNRILEIELDSADKGKVIKELSSLQLEFEEVDNTIQVFHAQEELASKLDYLGRLRSGTLEDVFFKMTGRTLGE